MDSSYNQRNREQTERLKALGRWSDDELARPVGEHWTVGVALAHVAYYDGRVLGTVEASLRHGIPRHWWSGAEARAVNDARLETWRAVPPREALNQAVRTAEALDRLIESLPADLATALAEERPNALDRSRHRAEHLDEIERAVKTERVA
jgi:hypothetical protein